MLGAAAAGRCRQPPAASRPQQRPNRRWRTRTSLRSTATGGCMLRRLIRTRPKCRSTHQRLSSMHRWLNTINLAAARRSPGAGGHASCPHPCTRTSSRASSDFILCRCASNARERFPPSACYALLRFAAARRGLHCADAMSLTRDARFASAFSLGRSDSSSSCFAHCARFCRGAHRRAAVCPSSKNAARRNSCRQACPLEIGL